jgi:ribosome-associated protein
MKRNPIEVIHFTLNSEHIALNDLLKATGIADSGGAGKALVMRGNVTVDDQPETRKTAKIRGGQKVKLPGFCVLTHAAGSPA